MFKKLCDNLNTLMIKERLNSNELGRRTGLPASTIKKIRNCDNPNPTLTTLIPIAKYFSVTVSELIGEKEDSSMAVVETTQGLYKVPLISWEDAINLPSRKFDSYINIENKYSKNTFALVVLDDDWENLAKGTILIVDPLISIEHRDLVVIFREDHKIVFLKQIIIDETKIYMKSLIPGCQMSLLTPIHKILGVVMEYRKHTKVHSKTKTETVN